VEQAPSSPARDPLLTRSGRRAERRRERPGRFVGEGTGIRWNPCDARQAYAPAAREQAADAGRPARGPRSGGGPGPGAGRPGAVACAGRAGNARIHARLRTCAPGTGSGDGRAPARKGIA
jgi:hypothetical protein